MVRPPQLRARIISLLLFSAGIVNVASVLWGLSLERLDLLEQIFPVDLLNATRTMTIIAGGFLLVLSRGVWQQKHRAWTLGTAFLAASFLFHLAKGLDVEEAIFLLVPLALLVYYRYDFTVLSGRPRLISAVRGSAFVLLFLLVYTVVGALALRHDFAGRPSRALVVNTYLNAVVGTSHQTLVPQTALARWFERSLDTISLVAIFAVFVALFSPALFRRQPTEQERQQARRLILGHGDNSSAYFSLLGDKELFFTSDRACGLCYKVAYGTAVVLGDPLGPVERFRDCIRSFTEMVSKHGVTAAFLSVRDRHRPLYGSLGFQLLKIGEEAIIPVSTFTLAGKAMDDVRHGVTRMQRERMTFRWFRMDDIPPPMADRINVLHRDWLQSKRLGSLTFSVNLYPLPPEPEAFVLVAIAPDGNLHAALTFYPYHHRQGLALELMLRDPRAKNGLMEAAIAEAVLHFRARGIRELSLGVAPLSDVHPDEARGLVTSATRFIFENVNQFYRYRSLFLFKKKFNPVWQSHYLAYPNATALPRVTMAIARVHTQRGFWASLWPYFRSRRVAAGTT